MKRYQLLIFSLCAAWQVFANDTIPVVDSLQAIEPVIDSIPAQRLNLLLEMRGVELIQDSTVARLLQQAIYGKQEVIEMDGYRVQIYSSNQQQTAKAEALSLEEKLKDDLPYSIYVTYMPPFWKVRIGDFLTVDEAKEYKKIFVERYPSMIGDTYIVRDKIKVIQ